MKAKILFFPILILIGYSAGAQWVAQTSPTQSSINAIHFNTDNAGFIASGYGLQRTLDGGNSWSQPTFTGSQLESDILINAFIYDIHFIDGQKGFMVGGGYFNTYDIVARTLDGGATWSLVYYAQVQGTSFRVSMTSIAFVNATTGFATGGKGRVLKTTDGGATWSNISLSTTQNLTSVYFRDTQTGFIAGNNVLYKTVNGGSTWSAENLTTYEINDFHFYDANNGIAATTSGAILKTTDGGSTWTEDLLLRSGFSYSKIDFAGTSGYILANNGSYESFVLKTSDGGATWGKQALSPSYGMYGMDVTPNGIVWAGGYVGKLYKTTNGGGQVLPLAAFSVSAPQLCENTEYTFQNHGYAQYTYEWRVDGVLTSTAYNFTTTLPNGEHTIELTAINGTVKATASKIQYVEADESFIHPLEITYTDGICTGAITTIRVREQEWGTYELYQNGVKLTGHTENYPYHYFPTPALTQTTTFTVKVTRSNSCQTFETSKDVTVTVHPYPTTGSVISAVQPDICNEGATSIRISNSKSNVRYSLYRSKDDWQPITTVVGNGGNALLNTPVLKDTTQYLVKASVTNGVCTTWFEDTVRVNVERVVASFELGLINTPAGEPVSVTNNSIGATNFSWNFSSASNPTTSVLRDPGSVIFTGQNKHAVTLTASSASGCSDSDERSITIYDPAVIDPSCWVTEIVHKAGNLYTATEEFAEIESTPEGDIIVVSPYSYKTALHSETLGAYELPAAGSPFHGPRFMARYSSRGVLKWIIKDFNMWGGNGGQLTVAPDGSIYVHGGNDVGIFYSVDGTTVEKPHDNYPAGIPEDRTFVAKYSPQGNIIWVKSYAELGIPIEWHYTYSIQTDAQGNIYLANDKITKISPAGVHLWTTDQLLTTSEYEFGRFAVAGDGSSYLLQRNQPLELIRFSKDGVQEWKHTIPYINGGSLPGQTKIGADHAGNLIFLYADVWGTGLQLPDPNVSTAPSSLWLVKFAPNGTIAWVNKSKNLMYGEDLEVSKNGTINLKANCYAYQLPDQKTALQSQDGIDIQLDFSGNTPFLITYDPSGVTMRTRPFRDPEAGKTECGIFNLDLASHGNDVFAIGFPICESIINGDIIHADQESTTETPMYLAKFDIGCDNIPQKMEVSITDNQQDQFCAGSIMHVNYLISGPFNGNHVFNVYLSNEYGAITKPRATLIGTVTSDNPIGTIEAVIPEDVVWGVPYYVRVIVEDLDPELYSTLIPVNKNLNSATFIPDFDFNISDLNITLTATGRPGVLYEWVIEHYQTGTSETVSGGAEAGHIVYHVPEWGNYTVYLTQTDACGNTGTTEKGLFLIQCENYAGADFTYTVNKKTVTFTTVIDPGRTSTFAWDFHDGTTSTEKNPVHTYATYGSHAATLTVTNECGGGHSSKTVLVNCPAIDPKISYTQNGKTVSFTHTGTSALPAESTYLWTFGDGATSTEKNPQHTYASFASYSVSLTETNECSNQTVWVTAVVSCPNPVANFTTSIQNLNVLFTSTSQNVTSFSWNFGDGSSTSTSSPVEHTYLTPGSYTVVLTATNSCGMVQSTQTVTVACPKPVLTFTPSAVDLAAFFTSTFQHVTSVHWNFGDGTTTETTSTIMDHVYTETGTYQVCMSATNACGTEQVCKSVEITCPIPETDFRYEIASGNSVTFITETSNYTSVLWTFGDGGQSNSQVAMHHFEPGTYEVCLEMGNACGSEKTCQEVAVVVTGQESALSKSIFTYPNPVVSDHLQIRSEETRIDRVEVITVLGTRVYLEHFDTPKREFRINTQTWSPGEYILMFTVGGDKLTRKIVKK